MLKITRRTGLGTLVAIAASVVWTPPADAGPHRNEIRIEHEFRVDHDWRDAFGLEIARGSSQRRCLDRRDRSRLRGIARERQRLMERARRALQRHRYREARRLLWRAVELEHSRSRIRRTRGHHGDCGGPSQRRRHHRRH